MEPQTVKWEEIGDHVLCEKASITFSGEAVVNIVPASCQKDHSSDQQRQVFLRHCESLQGVYLGQAMQACETANIEIRSAVNEIHIFPYYVSYYGNFAWTVQEQREKRERREAIRARHGFAEPEAKLCFVCKEANITVENGQEQMSITVYGDPSTITTSYFDNVATVDLIF